jgi:hypothetical protein
MGALGAGRISIMLEDRPARAKGDATRPGLPKDQSRLDMMAREKRMTVEERLQVFEALSRTAAWARSAKRIR